MRRISARVGESVFRRRFVRGRRSGLACLTLLPCLMIPPCFLSLAPDAARAAAKIAIDAVYVASREDRSGIVIALSGRPAFRVFTLDAHPRLVIDIEGGLLPVRYPLPRNPGGAIRAIRTGHPKPGVARIVFDLGEPVKIHRHRLIHEEGGTGAYLFVEIRRFPPSSPLRSRLSGGAEIPVRSEPPALPPPGRVSSPPRLRPFIVVLDPGHGGRDPGAVEGNVYEKHVVFAFTKELARYLNGLNGYRAILTREDDRSLSLQSRVDFAKSHGAALFLSIHADRHENPAISGASVYSLSDKASDREAAALARKENNADLIAGFSGQESDPDIARILIDLARAEKMVESRRLARLMIQALEGSVSVLRSRPHRHADFKVLRLPSIASALVEIGYLSNGRDRKNLQSPIWRARAVSAIARAIAKWRASAKVGLIALK